LLRSRLLPVYSRHIRGLQQEEPFDLLVFRPIACWIVVLSRPFPVTPNHFSALSLASAIGAGFLISSGTPLGFFWGGLGLWLVNIFDCCDGMCARIKGNGSRYGDLIDILVDFLSGLFIYAGLCFGLLRSSNSLPLALLGALSGLFAALHIVGYHHCRRQAVFYLRGEPEGRKNEIEKYAAEYSALKRTSGHYFEKLLLGLFSALTTLQTFPSPAGRRSSNGDPRLSTQLVPLWGGVAGSTHVMLLAISMITNRPGLYLFYALAFCTVWVILIALIRCWLAREAAEPA